MSPRYFYGWTVYLASLQGLHGWSASTVSAPVTVYYVAGALLTAATSGLYERLGPRAVVIGGSIAMVSGVAALGIVARPWQLYPVFLVMSVGWGAMSGAAINVILAPWWQRRRGLAVSIASLMRRDPRELGLGPDSGTAPVVHAEDPAAAKASQRGRGEALRTWRFWSVSAPFALGLAAQVGVLTHLVALVTPTLGGAAAARAV